jgi:CRP/FNR family transcriptional regulator, cyclic AMP receptor protein
MQRFSGRGGKTRLINAICAQEIVAGNQTVAAKLAAAAERYEFRANKNIVAEGGADNHIFFILSGLVSVQVNGREVATRGPGKHFGEMAMLDTTARRSATIITIEPTVVVRVPEHKFATIASATPDLWRRLAVALAGRLRERNKFQAAPRVEPAIFIGSSGEGLAIARAISDSLKRQPFVPNLWSESIFECSKTTIESLIQATTQSDFAVLVLTADDVTRSRGRSKPSPRDNVLFEMVCLWEPCAASAPTLLHITVLTLKSPAICLGLHISPSSGREDKLWREASSPSSEQSAGKLKSTAQFDTTL